MSTLDVARRPSDARQRLLDAATATFYADGIHAVGVERIVVVAATTRATFYRHFASKDELVVAYLEGLHQQAVLDHERAAASGASGADILRELGGQVVEAIRSPGFRGCAFLKAAGEYPDTDHPAHRAVVAHRRWLLSTITGLFAQAGDGAREPEGFGRHFVLLRDGAMAGGYLGSPTAAAETFLRGIEGLLHAHAGGEALRAPAPAGLRALLAPRETSDPTHAPG